MKTTALKLSEIVTTAGTQIRAAVSADTVEEYAAAMDGGAEFPPLVVFHDGNRYILADGFHRVMAATRNGSKQFACDVRKGTKSDALKFALGANSEHGLPRTNRDKRRSVELALAEWPKLSDREIAKVCAVHHDLVSSQRKLQLADSASSTPRIGGDGKERKLPTKPTTRPAVHQPAAIVEARDVQPTVNTYALRHVSQPASEPQSLKSQVEEAYQNFMDQFAVADHPAVRGFLKEFLNQ